MHMIPLYWFYYIQYPGVFKGFFLFYFIYLYFILGTHFGHNYLIYSKYVIRKGNGPLFQVNHLKSQSFFILIPDGANRPAPLNIFLFVIPTIPKTPQDSACGVFVSKLSSLSCRKQSPGQKAFSPYTLRDQSLQSKTLVAIPS